MGELQLDVRRATGVRHVVLGLTAAMSVLLYLDRTCISVAAPAIRDEFCLTSTQTAWIFGGFFLSYALAQVPTGWLVEPGAGPVERLLQEQVVLCWLFVRVAELRAAGRPNSFPEGDFYGRQLSRAQGRYLAAVRALLAARKLLRPSPSPLELASQVLDEAPEARGGRLGGRAGVGGN